jgi:hypothetical protein
MVGLRFRDVGPRGRHVVGGLVERLLRGDVAAGQGGHTDKLRFHIGQLRFRLGDLGRKRGNLLGAHARIDVVAGGGRGLKGGTRLAH